MVSAPAALSGPSPRPLAPGLLAIGGELNAAARIEAGTLTLPRCLVLGYLVMDSFSSEEEVREMRDRMAELVAGFDGANTSVFSTKDHVRLDGD